MTNEQLIELVGVEDEYAGRLLATAFAETDPKERDKRLEEMRFLLQRRGLSEKIIKYRHALIVRDNEQTAREERD